MHLSIQDFEKVKSEKLYIAVIAVVFIGLAVVFDTFPRSTFSELEKRPLKQFPKFTVDKLMSGTFTSEVSSWFSDSEPFRDRFMSLSMELKDLARITTSQTVTFHAAETKKPEKDNSAKDGDIEEYVNRLNADDEAKIAHSGIIIVGKVPNVRALMAYGGSASGGVEYANAVNLYKKTFPKANVYAMVIPIPAEFYCPDEVRKRVKPQLPTIKNIHAHLTPDVKAVDAYTPLARHAAEDIYMRTDHHWLSLGAYYAAQAFAAKARVPFPDLKKGYRRHVVHRYVGSMYGYSHDIAVKQSPEDFVYYTPIDSTYTTSYVEYQVEDGLIRSESRPFNGPLFYSFRDGSPHTYGTFLGGDARICKIKTQVKSNRRLLIIKDSFGNALPGFMTYSFQEVHVVDFRYFTKNLRQYVADNHITDILIAFNIFNAYSASVAHKVENLLDQKDGIPAVRKKADDKKAEGKTSGKPKEQEKAKPSEESSPAAKPQDPAPAEHPSAPAPPSQPIPEGQPSTQ